MNERSRCPPELLHKMDAYWRAANYLSVGQIYLYDNPLLKEPLKLSHVKPLRGRALGHDAGPELHLRAPEPGHQEVRPRHVLHRRPRSRRPGAGRQHLPRRHLQRDLSEHQPGRGRAEEAVHAVLVSRRHLQPRRADDAGLDPRRRRAGLLAQPRLRRRVRQPRADRRLRRSATAKRRRGRWPRPGSPTSSSNPSPTARCCRSCISTATRSATRPSSRASSTRNWSNSCAAAAGRPTSSRVTSRRRCTSSWRRRWRRPSRTFGASRAARGRRTMPRGRAGR